MRFWGRSYQWNALAWSEISRQAVHWSLSRSSNQAYGEGRPEVSTNFRDHGKESVFNCNFASQKPDLLGILLKEQLRSYQKTTVISQPTDTRWQSFYNSFAAIQSSWLAFQVLRLPFKFTWHRDISRKHSCYRRPTVKISRGSVSESKLDRPTAQTLPGLIKSLAKLWLLGWPFVLR